MLVDVDGGGRRLLKVGRPWDMMLVLETDDSFVSMENQRSRDTVSDLIEVKRGDISLGAMT